MAHRARRTSRGPAVLKEQASTPATQTGVARPHAALISLQRTAGNRAVARSLASNQLQRDPDPAAAPPAGGQATEADPAKPGADPVWAAIAKAITEQLGDEKIKEHAKTLAGKGVDLLISQVKDATSEKEFLARAQAELLGTMLSDQLKKDAEALVMSDAGKALRERLATITKESPAVVLAAAIAAAAVAYLANVDVPEISKKVELLKGLTAEGKLDLGKVQQLTVKSASAALKYTSTSFSAGVFGAYAGEGDKHGASGGANVAFGDKNIQFKGALKLNPDGTASVDLGQAIDINKFNLETGATIEKDKMAAIISVKIGDKDTYVSGKTTVGDDGKVAVNLGFSAAGLTVSGGASGLGGDKPTAEASLTGTNIFGVKGLDAEGKLKIGAGGLTSASGGVSYAADTKQGKAFISFKAETVAGPQQGPPIGAQGVIGIGFRFK